MNRKQIVAQAGQIIHRIAPDAKVILYGSEARGTADKQSDIDLLILLNKGNVEWKDKETIAYPLYDLSFETGISISPLILTYDQWNKRPFKTPFYINVMNEGKEI